MAHLLILLHSYKAIVATAVKLDLTYHHQLLKKEHHLFFQSLGRNINVLIYSVSILKPILCLVERSGSAY